MRRYLFLVLVAPLLMSACGGDPVENAAPGTTASLAPATTAPVTVTTIDDGPEPEPAQAACELLAAALGPEADTAGFLATSASNCSSGSAGAAGTVTLDIVSDVDSSAYEMALASPDAGDPLTADGVGEMAATTSSDGVGRVVAYGGGRLVTISGIGVDRDRLIAVASAVFANL